MSKQCLDINQMQHLKELGVDTSNASAAQTDIWVTSDLDEFQKAEDVLVFTESESDYFEFENPIKRFTLQDILDLLPKVIFNDKYKGKLCIEYNEHNNEWIISYKELSVIVFYAHDENIIDAAYKMLCWCAENGYVDTKK